MDKVEKAILLKFFNYVTVTANWFIHRIEKKYSNEITPEKLNELKNLVKELESSRDELENEH